MRRQGDEVGESMEADARSGLGGLMVRSGRLRGLVTAEALRRKRRFARDLWLVTFALMVGHHY